MINLDQHSKDQNNNILPADWHKTDAVLDPAESTILSVDPTLNYSTDDSPIRPTSARPTEPVTPADAVDPIPAPSNQNFSPETPGDLLSAPNDDNESNSSLSPIPSPEANRNATAASNETQLPAASEGALNDPTHHPAQDAVPAAPSRQSTPLTELSGPMTPSRTKEEDAARREGDGDNAMDPDGHAEAKNEGQEGDEADGKSDTAEDATVVAADTVGESGKSRSPGGDGGERDGQVKMLEKASEPAGEGSAQPPAAGVPTSTQPKATPSGSTFQSQPNGINFAPSAADASTNQAPGSIPPTPQTPQTSQKPPSSDPPDEKASTILQLNTELLKVCMECQTRHMMQSAEFNAYATRLQSNLTWLAAAADRERHKNIPLPIMSPPTAVPWTSPQAINEFYHRLPNLFAKEIARRQKEAAQTNVGGVKRGPDTADDQNGTRKRLDTGERRLSNSGSAASPPHVRSPSVMSNGTVGSTSGMNVGLNVNLDAQGPPAQGMGMGIMTPQQATQQQSPAMRVSPETMQPANQQISFPTGGMSEAQVAQARERARMLQMRQNQQAMAAKEPQRMPPPSLPNGLPNPMAQAGNNPAAAGVNQSNNTQVMQAILSTFGQGGLQNYHALQQGAGHPFVNYMNNNVPGFLQLSLQQQLQRMQIVQNNIQQVRAQQAQRAAAAATAAGMNGINPQGVADAASPFSRHSGSPPNVSPSHLQQHPSQQMQHISPSSQSASLPYAGSNGMGLSMQTNMQANMQPQRPGTSTPQNMPTAAGIGGLPPGLNPTPQQRQLYLMQQQMHQRGNDGVMNPQQAYLMAQEKMRQDQQSRMSNHQQQSPPHNAGSPPNPGSLVGHAGMVTPGMPGIARSARSPTDAAPVTPRMPQKRPGPQNDPYHMALYNQANAQRQASMGIRPGTAMGGMTPQQQQASQYGTNGGTVNPGMMYAGATGMNTHPSPQQNWQSPAPQQQQQFHSVSPAALQHHPDSGTPRPTSSASNNPMVPNDAMGDSFDSMFNWSGT